MSQTQALRRFHHIRAEIPEVLETDQRFGFGVPTSCPNVPAEILTPRNTWANGDAYEQTAKKLADLFHKNFEKYAEVAGAKIHGAGPQI